MKILVVDDEPLIKQYIVQCIQTADAGVQVVGAVTSGVKALRRLEETPADLVLADITMPKMDGIELLQEIKKRYPATRVVMLTCHDDFTYARAAIQSQADNYLLKSELSPERLRTLFAELRDSWKERLAERAASHISQNHYLRRLVENDGTVLPVRETDLRANHIYLEDRAFLALFFRNNEKNLRILQDCLTGDFENPLFYAYSEKEMFLLLNICRTGAYQKNDALTAYFRAREQHMDGAVGCSRVHHHLEKLQTAIYEAVSDRDMRFYRSSGGSFSAESGVTQIEQHSMRAQVKVEDGDISAGCAELEKLLLYAQEHHPPVTALKDALCQTFAGIRDKLGVSLPQAEERVEDSASFDALRACAQEYLELLRGHGKPYSAPIRKALEYVEQRYTEEISLNMVADFVYLNRDYLSRQFKKEVGVNFTEFLMSLRMQKAKKLLETTNMRISDIALSVGMTNMSYFSTVFHKSFGCKPNEMRKRCKQQGCQ